MIVSAERGESVCIQGQEYPGISCSRNQSLVFSGGVAARLVYKVRSDAMTIRANQRVATNWLLKVLLVWVLAVCGPGARDCVAAEVVSADGEGAVLVILAPSGPVFLDLQIAVGAEPYRRWTGRYLARLLDTDRNGKLGRGELSLIPQRILILAQQDTVSDLLTTLAGHAESAEVSTDVFVQWVEGRIPRLVELIAQPKPADDAVRLAGLLDRNSDFAVSDQELQQAVVSLRFRDLDDDETFTISELVPYRDPRSRNAAITPDVASLPFFLMTDVSSTERVVDRILEQYGREGRVRREQLRVPGEGPDAAQLDRKALLDLLAQPTCHAELKFRLSDKANQSDVVPTVYSGAESVLQIASVVRGRVNLIVDGLKMSLVARGGGANNRMVTRGYLGQEFSVLDADRSQSLDEMEFEGLKLALQRAGAEVEFQQIDTDQDLQMTRQELFGYADREQAAVLSRLEMMVEQSGRTMFSLLDSNSDRRLTRREILQSGDRLKEYDLNADGAYSDAELGTEYVLTIGLGRSELGRTQGGAQMAGMEMLNAGDAILPGRGGLNGPAWFQLMDRNQDGDVSRREFPGTTEQFSQLDLDQDGLMSVEEAERLESAGDTPAK